MLEGGIGMVRRSAGDKGVPMNSLGLALVEGQMEGVAAGKGRRGVTGC